MNFTRENCRMMRVELLKIVYWLPDNAPEGSSKLRAADRIETAKNVLIDGPDAPQLRDRG